MAISEVDLDQSARTLAQPLEAKNLPGLLKEIGVPANTNVLHVGSESPPGRSALASLRDLFAGDVFGLDVSADRANQQSGAQVERMQMLAGDPFNASLPPNLGFCLVTLSTARIPDVFEELLYDRIAPVLAENGIVVTLFCRDASEMSLEALGVTHPNVRNVLQSFLRTQFETLTVDTPELIRSRFERCEYFEFVSWVPRRTSNPATEGVVWVVLRRKAPSATASVKALQRSPRPDQFPLSDLAHYLREVKASGISFLPVDQFAVRLRKYYARKEAGEDISGHSFGLLKFDIHRNIRRPLEIARVLANLEIPGLFLMMPRHPMNEGYYDFEETWDILREIRSLGHEVGLHPDLFHLIRTHGNLITGLSIALEDIRSRGFAVRALTVHGDTRPHIKARRLQANDFFLEGYRETKWDGIPPKGEEYLAEHVKKYSLRRISRKLGVEYFAELNFLYKGNPINREYIMYVTDNRRRFEMHNYPSRGDVYACDKLFGLTQEFVRDSIAMLQRRPFLALFHPQWYW